MKNVTASTIKLIQITCVGLILLACNVTAATSKATNWLDEPVNITFHNEPLSKVLKKISEQTGVSIAYDQELASEKVTGNYQNVKTSDAITRLFRSKNKSIQVNKAKKIIIVKTFGAKNFIWADTILAKTNSSQMTLEDVRKMHALQYKEYKERIADDSEILEGGLTRGEIKAMHNESNQLLQKRVTDKSEILEGGQTRGEIQALHKQQLKEQQALISNKNTILQGGVTRGEILIAHQKQRNALKTKITNRSEVMEGGMTRAELQSMHKQQAAEYQKSINENPINID